LESGQRVIDLKQQKTGNHVVIPVRPELQAILNKYENRLPESYEQKMNKFIKEVAREAGIPTIAIMKITGHKTKKEFMKYIKITEEQTAMELMKHPYFSGR